MQQHPVLPSLGISATQQLQPAAALAVAPELLSPSPPFLTFRPSTDPQTGAGPQVKLLLSSGGTFRRQSSTSLCSYEGGENRLVSTPVSGSFQALLADMGRASTHPINPATCSIKYELPETPEQLIDLKTDADVNNMWEEWEGHRQLIRKPTFKLRVYVQAHDPPRRTSSSDLPSPTRRHGSFEMPSSPSSIIPRTSSSGSGRGSGGSAGSGRGSGGESRGVFGGRSAEPDSAPHTPSRTSMENPTRQLSDSTPSSQTPPHPLTPISELPPAPGHPRPCHDPLSAASLALALPELSLYNPTPPSPSPTSPRLSPQAPLLPPDPPPYTPSDLRQLESKFELIPPDKIHVTRALGEGAYGEVYTGTWLDVEVAVKCLNTAVFNPDDWRGPPGSISPSFFSTLVQEANTISSFRHPNIVWIYGVVLPTVNDVVAAERGAATATAAPAGPPSAPEAPAHRPADAAPPRLTAAGLAAATGGAVGAIAPSDACEGGRGEAFAPGSGLNGMDLDERGLPREIRPPAIVVEFMSGRSLRGALVRGEEYLRNPLIRVKIALDTARGMAYLHSKHRPHLDLKSSNVIVGFRDRQPIAKVTDFGLLRYKMRSFLAPSNLALMKNTLPWVAPELLRGLPPAGLFSADVYSFGVVMWELWTCHMPFPTLDNAQLLTTRLSNPDHRPPIPGSFHWEGDTVPAEPGPGWSELMQECWATDASARPPFDRVVARLHSILAALKAQKRGGAATA